MATRGSQTSDKSQQRLKKRAQKRLRIVLVVALPVFVLLVIALFPMWRRHQAKRDVNVLVLAMRGFAFENGRYPSGTPAQIAALLRGKNVGGQNPKQLDYIVAAVTEVNAVGEFVDPWGTSYRISTESEARAYSCGPNRKDEAGDGDDIASWK